MTQSFTTDRKDGRSDRQVVLDLVASARPGDIFTFDQIKLALMSGTNRLFDRAAVGNAVRAARDIWLTQDQRTLRSVRNEGYRVCRADEHNDLALDRKRRADTQMKKGLSLLNNVRWDEMTPTQRQAHEGTLLVVGAMYQQQAAADRRANNIESLLANLVHRIDQVESQ